MIFQKISIPLISFAVGAGLVTLVSGCTSQVVANYDAIAEVSYTWQVNYTAGSDRPNDTRREQFASTSLINQNGELPVGSVTGPDDQGLWWPELPPRPTVDEIESRRKSSQERVSAPELIKNVDYRITFQQDGETMTLPTEYSVYRAAAKAYEQDAALELTVIDDVRVEKAEVVE